jgi:hypothetical protein
MIYTLSNFNNYQQKNFPNFTIPLNDFKLIKPRLNKPNTDVKTPLKILKNKITSPKS